MKIIFSINFLVIVFLGCSQKPIYIVQRDVPSNPSFTVLPANELLYQVHFANRIEEFLIGSGVKVNRRPASKYVETKQNVEKVNLTPVDAAKGSILVTEAYRTLEEFSTDFLVETYADSKQIKFTNRKTNEVLTVFILDEGLSKSDYDAQLGVIHDSLEKLGVKVKTLEKKSESKRSFYDNK